MECKKDEATKAMDTAERKLSEHNYNEARKFATKAQNLYPQLNGLKQMLMMINVYISATNGGRGGEADWYGILGVDPSADDETVKKQYKKLALLIHPDKNKFNGAEDAFKFVLEASCLLSDKDRRYAYDRKRKSKQAKSKKRKRRSEPEPEPESEPESEPETYYEPETETRYKNEKVFIFLTVCNRCKTYCEFQRARSLNKTKTCPNCAQDFVATKINPEIINGRPVFRFGFYFQSARGNTSGFYDREKADAYEERMRSWFEPTPEPEPEPEPEPDST